MSASVATSTKRHDRIRSILFHNFAGVLHNSHQKPTLSTFTIAGVDGQQRKTVARRENNNGSKKGFSSELKNLYM